MIIKTDDGAVPLCPHNAVVHDNGTKWKHFPRYWSFVRGIHRSPVSSPHKDQWCEDLMWHIKNHFTVMTNLFIMKLTAYVVQILQVVCNHTRHRTLRVRWSSKLMMAMFYYVLTTLLFMMTSSNGNIFRVTGLLCEEFTDHRWVPRTKASDAKLWCCLWSAPE